MQFRNSWALFFCIGFLFSSSLFLQGQSTYGAVAGTVTDPSGAALADVQVTLTNQGTAEKRIQSTNGAGEYSFVNVIPGNYSLDIDKTGFKHLTRQPIQVQVQQSTRIDAALQIGSDTQTVEVSSETPLLQAETSSLGQVVEERKANELPLNGRNIFNLITISPAAVAQGGSGGTPVGQNPFSWGNYQVGGSFANQSAEYLDGQPLNIGYINLPIVIPTQDSIGEFKVQYNNLGAEWGKFSGGVSNFSTKSGTNAFHGEAYEFFRNKVLNSNDYFFKQNQLLNGKSNTPPPYVQNQYGFNVGGPVIKDKTFFFVSWEQFRLRTGAVNVTTVPLPAFKTGDFSALLAQGIQLYDPYTVQPNGSRTAYAGNIIPASEFSPAALTLWNKYFVAPTNPGALTNNFTSASSSGGNNNEFVARVDQNISDKTRLFGRFSYFGLLDLPNNPFGTGLCQDRCAENYHTKALAIDVNHAFSPNIIGDLNISASRFIYLRGPLLAGYDLTQLGWPASYNAAVPSIMRTPPTPAFPFPNDVGRSQGNSAIGDHNTQYNISPSLTVIHGKHTFQVGAQYELGLDNYYQTNIASGAFGFSGAWTSSTGLPTQTSPATGGFAFADFLLGLAQPGPASFVNQTEGAAQVPAQTAGRQTYRAFYGNDTWHVTNKLTLNLGLRYELQGPWSDRYDRLSYFDPTAVNATVTGCSGTPGSQCIGDAMLVKTGPNSSRNNIPLNKTEFSPRIGFAFSADPKTVIRAGYGIFWIPNYVSFGLNPDNDVINLATTPFHATLDQGLTPNATLDQSNCTFNFGSGGAPGTLTGCTSGPFGASGILPPPGRSGNISNFVATNGSPTLAPYTHPQPGYVEQYNFNIQRQLPAGFFADVAYAGSHGVHLQQYSTNINQIPDRFIAQAAAQAAAGQNPTINQQFSGTNPNPIVSPDPSLQGTTVPIGQLDRPYPQYTGLSLAGYGCCSSNYNSLQATVTRRFQGGGTMLVAYTNAKLLSNTDTLTSWLEGSTGGVGQVQDWNNLNGERSLSSQDVSQRLVISYVLDLPFGRGKKFLGGASGVTNKAVSGWGIDGVTTFQRGFPLKITWAGNATPLENANLGVSNVRPDVIPGCNKSGNRSLTQWFNTNCFAPPPAWGFGNESRVDPTLRAPGINNFDFAAFKRTTITERVGLEFRTEFFNLFNHPRFGVPGTGFNGTPTGAGNNGFGVISSTNPDSNPRLIQFALKLLF
ncbi:MAG TPA: TonB-dependent receptor [Terriglobales bacterium]|nr:TonB-dependent receptor [Terriglobales bacterium]